MTDRTPIEPILDASVLDDLAAIDDGLLVEVLESFLNDVPARIAAIQSAAAAADGAAVASAAHALKGSALAIGAIPLVTLCTTIEQAARENRRDALRDRIAELHPVFSLVRAALEARC